MKDFPGKNLLAGCRHTERAETGPVQFGNDWPGSFMRGDQAGHFAFTMSRVLADAERAGLIDHISAIQAGHDIRTISDSDDRSNAKKTRLLGPLGEEHAQALIGLLLDGTRPSPEVELSIIGALSCFADERAKERLDARIDEIVDSSPEMSTSLDGLRYGSVRWHRLHKVGIVKNGLTRHNIYHCLGEEVEGVRRAIQSSGKTINGLQLFTDINGIVIHSACDP